MTFVLRHHRLGALTLEGPRVLAILRMILAGKEWPEEAAARLELSAAIGAAQLCHFRQIVSRRDQRACVDLVE